MTDPAVINGLIVLLILLGASFLLSIGRYITSYCLVRPTILHQRKGRERHYTWMIAPKYLLEENKRLHRLIEEKNQQLENQAQGRIKRDSNKQMTFLPSMHGVNGHKPVLSIPVDGKIYRLKFKNQQFLNRFNSNEWIWVARQVRVGRKETRWDTLWARVPEKEPAPNDDPLDEVYYDSRYDQPLINKIPPTYWNDRKRKEYYIEDRWLPFSWEVEELPEDAPPKTFSASSYVETRKKVLKNGH